MSFDRNIWPSPETMSADEVQRIIANRQSLLRKEIEDYLRSESLAIDQRRKQLWHWDYSSPEAFVASVEPNRERWRQALGVFGPGDQPLEPQFAPFLEDEYTSAHWLTLPFLGHFRARAVLALPKETQPPYPLVVAQHGISSSPERVFGFDDPSNIYHAYGRKLVRAGFAVLAPMNVTFSPPRSRLNRLCLMLGGTLWGLEVARTARLLDYLATREDIDAERMGMWGISLGGAYTMFTMPVEPRLRVGIVTAWFNHRVQKMVIEDPRYSCFLPTEEEYVFVPGWLREFSDSDLGSLICPRPLQIQAGKCDGIHWWPMMLEEYEALAEHYRRLGLEERISLDLHEGGHEIDTEAGIAFMRRWLAD